MQESLPHPPSGRYLIRKLLGHGGMGSVFEGWDPRLKRRVALKFLKDDLVQNPQIRQRFLREGRALARLAHEHVVGVYEVDEEGPLPFIAQEFLEGQDLEEMRLERRFEDGELRLWARHLAEALAGLHGAGLIHRDLKPANCFITTEGSLRLLDFGLALATDLTRITAADHLVGTRDYLSPEMLRGAPITPASDVYQFGLVLHVLATGHLLDRSECCDWNELFALAMADGVTPAPLPELPADLAELIRRCCPRKVENRPKDGAALLCLLDEILAGAARDSRGNEEAEAIGLEAPSAPYAALPSDADGASTGQAVLPKGPWHRGVVLVATACLLLLLVHAARRRETAPAPELVGPPPLSRPGLRLSLFPDGFFLSLPSEGLEKPALRLTENASGKSRLLPFLKRGSRMEVEGRASAPASPLSLEILSAGRSIHRTVVHLPSKGPSFRIRSAADRLSFAWDPMGPEPLRLYLGAAEGALTFRGSFSGKAEIPRPPRWIGKDLRYSLRLGTRVLAESTLPRGSRSLHSAPLRDSNRQMILRDCLHRPGRSLDLLFKEGRVLSLEARETTSGLVLTKSWAFDSCAPALWPRGCNPRDGRLVPAPKGRVLVLFPDEGRSLVLDRKSRQEGPSTVLQPRAGESLRPLVPCPRSPLLLGPHGSGDRKGMEKNGGFRLVGPTPASDGLRITTLAGETLEGRHEDLPLPCMRLLVARETKEGLLLAWEGPERLHLGLVGKDGMHHHLRWTVDFDEGRRKGQSLGLVPLPGEQGLVLALGRRLEILHWDEGGRVRRRCLDVAVPSETQFSPGLFLPSGDLVFLCLDQSSGKNAIGLMSRVRILSLAFQNGRPAAEAGLSPRGILVPELYDRKVLTPLLHHRGRLFGAVYSSRVSFDAQLPCPALERFPEDSDPHGLFMEDGVALLVQSNGCIRAMDL